MKIAVIGAGSWGTALANLLSLKNYEVMVWGRNQKKINEINKTKINRFYLDNITLDDRLVFSTDFDKTIKDSKIIIFAVASQAVRKVLKKYYKKIEDQIIVNVAKGIETSTLMLMSDITEEFLPENKFVALSGPSHAEEVSKKMPTTIVAASKDRYAAEKIQDVFTTDYLRVYTNPDIIGVEIGGSLKNIIALGAGISDGLGYGDNAKAALMTRGIKEITKLGVALGANQATFSGLTGIGDLIVTCTSMHSRNRRCGIMIGKGLKLEEAIKEVGMVVEGAETVKAAYKLSQKYNVYMPITKELYEVLYKEKEPDASVRNLMMKRKKHEFEDVVNEEDWL